MDKNRIRELAGIPLNESAVVSSRGTEGPNILISIGDRFGGELDVREANLSSFRVKVSKKIPKGKKVKVTDKNFQEIDRADTKIAEQKLKEIEKLSKKFQADIKKVLSK